MIMALTLRLAEILRREKNKAGGWKPLSDKILDANKKKVTLDRRRLQRLAYYETTKGREIAITIEELKALDAYLALNHCSLADEPLFERDRLLDEIAKQEHVTFVVGSRVARERRRTDIDVWDVQAVATLMSELSQRRRHVTFDLKTRLVENNRRVPLDAESLLTERTSLCAIGAPHACDLSEIILAKMFQLKAFQERGARSSVQPPFEFVNTTEPRFESAFAIRVDKLPRRTATYYRSFSKAQYRKTWALRLLVDGADTAPLVADGVIVAQRRSSGHVWAVFAGTSGPSTLGAAQLAARWMPPLRGGDRGDEHGPVVFAAVKVAVQIDPNAQGDQRILGDVAFIQEPTEIRAG